ncbi:MAG: glycosyltransferase family 4 protein [Acidobacteria bacterium]|nr:glycosyltransferase family 4 protein [Acidobacteriota bacterium]
MNPGSTATWARRVRLWQRRLRMQRAAARARDSFARRTRHVPARVASDPLGVSVVGPMAAASGMGQATRATVNTLRHVDVETVDVDYDAGAHREPPSRDLPFTIIHFNADRMLEVRAALHPSLLRDRYVIGVWFWELPEFRADWLSAFNAVDEVWAPSEFIGRTLREAAPTTVPVVDMPPGLTAPAPSTEGRAEFGLPPDACLCLSVFDVSSQVARKHPLAAIAAFRAAKFAHGEAALVFKCMRADRNPQAIRELQAAADGLPLHLITDDWPVARVHALMACTDVCLSLHRAEGLGLTMAEQMWLGKPAVATAWSGNVDFMTADDSCLVPAALVRIDRDYGPYLEGGHWAEADIPVAAAALRRLATDPGAARAMGQRARARVSHHFDRHSRGQQMRHRLLALQREAAC